MTSATPISSRTTGSFRVPHDELGGGASRTQLSAMWASARARNALRRRWQFASVSASVLVVALLTLLLVPRQAAQMARLAAPRPGEKVDTLALVTAAGSAQREFISADSAVTVKRDAANRVRAIAIAQVQAARAAALATAGGTARRDSLASLLGDLDRLVARSQNSPLPSSYRALADAPAIKDDARVRQLVDSLDDVEREREAFGVVSGVDPIYVQLTNTVNRLGRSIEAVADRQRGVLRDQIAALSPTAPDAGAAGVTVPVLPSATAPAVADSSRGAAPVPVDTAAEALVRAEARQRADLAAQRLADARARNVAVDRRVAAARDRANIDAPPQAMLIAAGALAIVVGFIGVLVGEIRRPRVADAREAERVSRLRVLAVVRPGAGNPDRTRRRADVEIPSLIDSSIESYRMLYLSLAATGAAIPVVAVTGDDAAIAATVAANVAAVAAEDGRGTLVVDGDMARGQLSSALGVRARLGMTDLARASLPLAEAIVPVTIGRGLTVDVVPAGIAAAPPAGTALDALRDDIGRLARRYDFTVIGVPPVAESDVRGLRIAPDVILCARTGHTPLAGLAREVQRLREAGARVRGVVLWEEERPSIG